VASSKLCISTLACCALFSTCLRAQTVPNPRQLITEARQAYYNLPAQGMAGFQCSVTPKWETLLRDALKENPEGGDRAIKLLSQLRFVVTLGEDGKVKLTHNELPGQNKETNDGLAQIYGGMEQMTSGFYDTWSLFVINSPLPLPDSKFQLQAGGPLYLLAYTEGTAEIATTLTKDFAISEMKVTTPEFDSVIHPEFIRTPKGFLLSAYTASYESKNPGETTHLRVLIDYQETDGMQMLRKLGLSGSYGGSQFAIDLAFSDCQVTKKPAVTANSPR
jgi:hypothetical protein